MTAADYNYADFSLERETPGFLAFRDRLHVGDPAPDGDLVRLDDGATVRLGDYRATGLAVVEFGSFT